MKTALYRILDRNVSIESDSEELLDRFDRDYGCFKVHGRIEGNRLCFSARLQDESPMLACTGTGFSDDAGGPVGTKPRTIRPDSALRPSPPILHSLSGHPSPVSQAVQWIVQTLFAELTSFIILHAGVVEKNGRALILSGPPGTGKSTLTLALLERGFGLLSDDVCPVDRATGRVHPFPRTFRVVDADCGKGEPRKRPIAPEQLPGRVRTSPCIPGWLICLDAGERPGDIRLAAELRSGEEQAFVEDMAGIEAVRMTRLSPDFPKWRISYPAHAPLSSAVGRVIEKHRDRIWNLYRMDRVRPDFDRPPVPIPLAGYEAALAIMGELKQKPDSSRSDWGRTESPGAYFAILAGLLSGVSCYRLTVGRLEEMIRQIEGVME